ncbi:cofilin-2-like isoform X1 [Notothenia coriiceps]|uniref:Cofilin-2-like isoform X1 n=1 Tax=Notothenia coriiceps TaxID=8208 RepID=A0A6I9PYP0_9TELE|nr:PREDICTED: cofilin-2-like isoform X1 [Notothenia coriiceps]
MPPTTESTLFHSNCNRSFVFILAKQASGVQVADEVKQIFNVMKVVKNDDDEKERIRIVQLWIDGEIKVENIYREKDLEGVDNVFKFIKDLMRPDQSRYFLYDCHFDTKESGRKEELIFMMWAPDNGPMKSRMQYASSKSAMCRVVQGVKHIFEMHDVEDMEPGSFAERLKHNVLKMEGHPLRGN